jgi:hypothetical protein
VDPEQFALVRQATHWFETGSHVGVAPEQSASVAHCTHWPAFIPVVTQAAPLALPAQSTLLTQGLHVWLPTSHLGVLPLQSELNSHPTHVPVG